MKREDRKKQLLRIALHVFAEEKYANATTAKIAAAAGVTEPTIYRHFESKKHLFIAVLNDCRKLIMNFTRNNLKKGGGFKMRYHATFKMQQRYATQVNQDVAKVWVIAASVNDPDIGKEVRRFDKEMRELLAKDIRESAKAENISLKYDPEVFARIAISLFVEWTFLIMIDMNKGVEKTFDDAMDLLLNAIH
jgi:AcrR family transcriptional regulator